MKKILVVVDMQNDFIDGSLGTKEAQAIVGKAAGKIRSCKEEGYTVLGTLDTHAPNYLDTAEGKKLPVKHCIKGTQGWELNPVIEKEMEGCFVVEKTTFGSLELPQIIEDMAEDEEELRIELIGLCTDICVVSNALILKASFPEDEIAVDASCCAGVTPEKHLAALETMQSCQITIL